MSTKIDQQNHVSVGIDKLMITIDETNDVQSNNKKSSEISPRIFISDSNSTTKPIKDVFNLSKIYFKYLLTIKMKITNNNVVINDKIKEFNEYYDNATIIYDVIKKEWFWITNGEKMSQFILNSEPLDNHRANFFNNYSMLESIAKMYGFDSWIVKSKLNTVTIEKRKQRNNVIVNDDLA